MQWKLADAKNKLSEVVTRAVQEGPQQITRRGDEVVVISKAEYEELSGKKRSFKEWLLDGPDLDGIEIKRDASPPRKVKL